MRLSKKYGVNPSITICPVCNKEMDVALLGYLKGDVEAPKCIKSEELCNECKTKYTTIIEIDSVNSKKATGRRAFVGNEYINQEYVKNGITLMVKDDFDKLFNN